jgi:hypothetical protein
MIEFALIVRRLASLPVLGVGRIQDARELQQAAISDLD